MIRAIYVGYHQFHKRHNIFLNQLGQNKVIWPLWHLLLSSPDWSIINHLVGVGVKIMQKIKRVSKKIRADALKEKKTVTIKVYWASRYNKYTDPFNPIVLRQVIRLSPTAWCEKSGKFTQRLINTTPQMINGRLLTIFVAMNRQYRCYIWGGLWGSLGEVFIPYIVYMENIYTTVRKRNYLTKMLHT